MLQIVASTIDADKIDYLLRDLLRTGALRLKALQGLKDGSGKCQQQRQGLPDFVTLIYSSRIENGRICFSKSTEPLVQTLLLAPVRALLTEPGCTAEASGWNGRLLARIVARDGWPLKRQLARVLALLSARPLPRVWQMQGDFA